MHRKKINNIDKKKFSLLINIQTPKPLKF